MRRLEGRRAPDRSSPGDPRRSAFTLVEMLVVVAILAVLAALLFPVFARAKLAAKKTVDLSNLKQTSLAAAMYLSDAEDRYPIQTARDADGGYAWGYVLDTPWDLRSGQDALYYEQNRCAWANSIQPYMKSFDMLGAPMRVTHWPDSFGDQRSQWVKKPASVSYAMNGLLEQYSSTAIASPAQLIAFSAPLGGDAIEGGAFAQPYLVCLDPSAPCVYTPTKKGCDGSRNGEWSGTWWWPDAGLNLRASFGSGSNYAYADGSAKFRRMGANVSGKTDFRTDPYTEYDRSGNAALSWYDSEYCHPLLYRPDFDFQSYGTPVEGV